jgi:hypothetical protein
MHKLKESYQLVLNKGKESVTWCLHTLKEVEYYRKKYEKKGWIFFNLKKIL